MLPSTKEELAGKIQSFARRVGVLLRRFTDFEGSDYARRELKETTIRKVCRLGQKCAVVASLYIMEFAESPPGFADFSLFNSIPDFTTPMKYSAFLRIHIEDLHRDYSGTALLLHDELLRVCNVDVMFRLMARRVMQDLANTYRNSGNPPSEYQITRMAVRYAHERTQNAPLSERNRLVNFVIQRLNLVARYIPYQLDIWADWAIASYMLIGYQNFIDWARTAFTMVVFRHQSDPEYLETLDDYLEQRARQMEAPVVDLH